MALSNEEKAKRYDAIVAYMKNWPYSPYDYIEHAALVRTIREIVKR